ncbi:hypothetical protein FKM82_022929 [Ascaphus truei]
MLRNSEGHCQSREVAHAQWKRANVWTISVIRVHLCITVNGFHHMCVAIVLAQGNLTRWGSWVSGGAANKIIVTPGSQLAETQISWSHRCVYAVPVVTLEHKKHL